MDAKTISRAEFDRRFDAGGDISDHLDWSRARRPGLDKKRVNVDFTESTSADSTGKHKREA